MILKMGEITCRVFEYLIFIIMTSTELFKNQLSQLQGGPQKTAQF